MDPNSNQNKPWYPNGAPIPGQEQGPQTPPFPPAALHNAPPLQPYPAPTRPMEAQPQQQQLPPQPQMQVQPQQQPNPPQYSIDYLNQIAPQPKKAGLDSRIFTFIIGGGLLLALIVGLIAMSGGSGPKEQMETLAARMQTLQIISDTAQKNIKSGKLAGTNSALTVFITNANHDIVDPLKTNGVEIKKIDKKIITAEKGVELSQKLEDARLNAVFDRTYAREMSYQLKTVESLMQTIYLKSRSKSLKDFLSNTDGKITPIIEQLDSFNTTTAND